MPKEKQANVSAMHKVTGNVTAVSEQSFSHAAKETDK